MLVLLCLLHIMKKYLSCFILCSIAIFGQTAWTVQSPAGLTDDIWCATFADETFVAVTGKGKVLSSSDGLTWSVQTVASGTWLVSVTYGAGLWVVVGEGGSIYYSADLKNWSAAKAVTAERINGVCHTGKTFVAVTEQGSVLTSTDAQTWKIKTGVSKAWLHGLAVVSVDNGRATMPDIRKYLFTSGGGGALLISADEGFTWSDGSYYLRGNQLQPSDNIEALASKPAVGSAPGMLAAAGGGSFVGAIWNYPNMSFSPGGYTNLTPRVVLRGLVYGSGVFVAAGDQGTIFTSPDGLAWTQRFSGDSPTSLSSALLLSVAYAESLQRFVAVGGNGTILVSNAAPSTLINVSTRGTVTTSDPIIGGFVVSGSAKKFVLIRAVGPTLSSFGVPKTLADPVIRLVDSRGVTVATNTGWTNSANRNALVAATARTTFPFGANSGDSALYVLLDPGSYTATVTSASSGTGTVLFEAYSP